MIQTIEKDPMPYTEEKIESIWNERWGETPTVDEFHEKYKKTIAKHGEWELFQMRTPVHDDYYIFNRERLKGLRIRDEGEIHHLENFFHEVAEQTEDCRDAEISSSLMPSSSYKHRCKNCGNWWTVG